MTSVVNSESHAQTEKQTQKFQSDTVRTLSAPFSVRRRRHADRRTFFSMALLITLLRCLFCSDKAPEV
ncbi:hypothetical protein EVAR_21042_1 [Eumeta japonica]|uniref:Uncharacterized protein n=1 Tax=Eumeta variegata TaxID=151549 RepID=A0A4C1V0K0_EUMVA|nr:hypothetical protein EVAR_21042_1 [Eumeta japonica]